jgi:hypothetical protein
MTSSRQGFPQRLGITPTSACAKRVLHYNAFGRRPDQKVPENHDGDSHRQGLGGPGGDQVPGECAESRPYFSIPEMPCDVRHSPKLICALAYRTLEPGCAMKWLAGAGARFLARVGMPITPRSRLLI